jgi:hypothetical protein
MPLTCGFVEPMTGIEPAYSAWKVDSTRLPRSTAVRRPAGALAIALALNGELAPGPDTGRQHRMLVRATSDMVL